MGKWSSGLAFVLLSLGLSAPLSAADMKLEGKYEIQGRYYKEKDAMSVQASNADTTPVTTMYLKHYFNLYPTFTVNDNIVIKGDIEAFDNIISKNDSRQWYDKSSTAAAYNTDGNGADPYDLFTINELYVDAVTPVGKFIAGKHNLFNGLAWFVKFDQVPNWAFGVAWNKRDENANKNSYIGYTSNTTTTTAVDNSDASGSVTNHDLADVDEIGIVSYYNNATVDFKGILALKKGGRDGTDTRILFPHFYLDYKASPNLKFNSKIGWGNGPLIAKDSPVGEHIATLISNTSIVSGLNTALGAPVFTAVPTTSELATVLTGSVPAGTELATAAFMLNTASAQVEGLLGSLTEMEDDWQGENAIGIWLGAGYTMDAFKIQVDGVYLAGAEAPNKVSGYLEDYETLDTWLLNDIADHYSSVLQTPATLAALPGLNHDGSLRNGTTDGWYSFANVTMARLNLAYQFSKKLDANINLVWARMTDTEYLENWNSYAAFVEPSAAIDSLRIANAAFPSAFKVGSTLNAATGGPMVKYDVDADMGYEVRTRVNYALMNNLSVGLDLCYYAPGKLYEGLIENNFSPTGAETGNKLEKVYGGRWTAKVTF